MATPSGLSAQLMIGEESTWGTPVAATRTFDLVNETVKKTIARIESKGLRAGAQVLRSQQWVPGKVAVAGDLNLELNQINFGLILKHALGTVATTGPVSGAYTHTITPGDLTGKGLTVEVAKPAVTGSVYPFKYQGCKVHTWELACKAGELATVKVGLVAQDEVVGTAGTQAKPFYPFGTRTVADGATNTNTTVTSATAAFTQADVNSPISGGTIPVGATITVVTNATTVTISAAATGTATGVTLTIGAPAMALLTFVQGVLTVGGSSVDVRDVTLKGNNSLDVSRYFVRANGQLIKEPLVQAWREWTGTLTADFTDASLYNRYINGTESALVLTFTGSNIPGGSTPYSLTITMNVRYDGDTPNVPGPAILTQPMTYKAIAPSTDGSAITAVYVTSDVTP